MATSFTFDLSAASTTTVRDAAHNGAELPAAPRRVLVRRAGRPMATDVSVQIAAAPEQLAAAESAADACMAWFDEVDRRLSRFRPESELSRLNAAAGRWFAASEILFEMVCRAVASAQASGGLFDPTLLRQLEALGYDRDFALIAYGEVPHRAALHAATAAPMPQAWRTLALDPVRRRVKLPPDAALDLGGIAKGWAADEALLRYCTNFPGALINVGGDLRLRGGPQPGTPWSVSIRDPRFELTTGEGASAPSSAPIRADDDQEPRVAVVTLSRGALATSGALRRWWLRDGTRQHHLLDPRTGLPVPLWIDERDPRPLAGGHGQPLIATATALAPTATRSEVAAKVALLRGYPAALRAVEAAWERYGAVGPETDVDAGVALVLTFGTGEVVQSKNVAAYLASWGTDGAPLPMTVSSTFPTPRKRA